MIKKLASLIILVFLHSFLSTEMIELDRTYFADHSPPDTFQNLCELLENCQENNCVQITMDCPVQCTEDCKKIEKIKKIDIEVFEAHI